MADEGLCIWNGRQPTPGTSGRSQHGSDSGHSHGFSGVYAGAFWRGLQSVPSSPDPCLDVATTQNSVPRPSSLRFLGVLHGLLQWLPSTLAQ